MAKKKTPAKPIENYQHTDKERANNPQIGMVNEATEKYETVAKKKYEYDPHLNPQLQWAGKAERTSFEVPTVSLHVHERIDPKTIIEAVKKEEEDDNNQLSLFEQEKKPLREAIEFYKHKEGWTNRLIAGDSLLVMNSLLEKEGMAGKVQMVYFDPPYGIKYGSNFQPFTNKKDIVDGKDEDLTQEPEMIKAFRDTWELGIHSYLSYLRDRLLLAKELLSESGSIFVQISDDEQGVADQSVAKQGETLRQDEWRDELLRTGVRAKGGAMLKFSRIEAQAGTKYIQALAETAEENPKNLLVVFGPEHSPMDARLVELAIDEARFIKPDILLFCAFQFDEEAAKDIDETPEKLVGFKLLKAQMNMDLQTEDLKKNRNTNQSFWLIGQPDVEMKTLEGSKVQVWVNGFDYYNPKSGEVDSGSQKNIALWLLDTDYDGRSLFPRQVFFPMAGTRDGWSKLAKSLRAEIDEEKIEAYRGTVSLPFEPGKQVAVKIIDDRGIESLKILKP